MSTLALNMIVAGGEAEILDRCIKSFAEGKLFDEIVIVNTSDDQDIDAVAVKYNAKCIYFEWCTDEHPHGDFAGARNTALKNSTTDYIMWLDSDDVLKQSYLSQFEKVISIVKDDTNSEIIIYSMNYTIISDVNMNPITSFTRERIFRRDTCSWYRRVHELITPDVTSVKNAIFENITVTHMPIKPQFASADRNIRIMEYEYKNGSTDIQTRYFLGRDYLLANKADESLKIFGDIIDNMESSYEMLYAIAMEVVFFFAYARFNPLPKLREMMMKNEKNIEKWLRLALVFNNKAAEPYVVLGDLYTLRGQNESAMRMYLTSLKKHPGDTKVRSLPYYNEVPYSRLALLYMISHEFEQALYYNKLWLIHARYAPSGIEMRKQLIETLVTEFNEASKNENRETSKHLVGQR